MAQDHEPWAPFFASFWDGETGTAIQRLGSDAVALATFIVTNRWAHMSGLYRLSLDDMAASLPCIGEGGHARHRVGPKGIRKRLRELMSAIGATPSSLPVVQQLRLPAPKFELLVQQLGVPAPLFYFDAPESLVLVPEMCRFRLQLDKSGAASPGDRRLIVIKRHLATIPASPCKTLFYARYATQLHLQSSTTNDVCPIARPSEAPSRSPIGHNSTGTTVQEEIKAAAAPPPTFPQGVENPSTRVPDVFTYAQLCKIGHTVIDERGLIDEGELAAEIKTRCGQLRTGYWSEAQPIDVLNRAVASVRTSRAIGLGVSK